MTIERFSRQAGSSVAQGIDDPTMLLIGYSVPDTVTLPIELGGAVRNVEDAFVSSCPCMKHSCVHLVLGDISVAECNSQFLWYRT